MDWVQCDRIYGGAGNVVVGLCVMLGVVPAVRAQESASQGQGPQQVIVEYETAPSPFVAGAAEVWDVALSPSGDLMATSAADGNVRLYDRASRELLRLVACHTDSVASLAFSTDGSLLATAGYDRIVKIWRMPGMQLQETLTGHTQRVVCTAFSPDGKRLASCGYDGTIRVWNVSTGEVAGTIVADGSTIRCVAFSADGTMLASGGDDGLVKLWDAATLASLAELKGQTARVRGVAFAPRGNTLASVGEDGATCVWDRAERSLLRVIKHGVPAWRLAFSSSGNTLATGYQDGSIRLFDVATGGVLAEQKSHSDIVSSLNFLPDDRTYYSASYDGSIFAWNARMPAQPAIARVPTDEKVWTTAVSSRGNLCAAAGRGGFVQVRDLRSGKLVREFDEGHPATIDRIEISRDGSLIATASWRSTEIIVWKTEDGTKKHRFEADSKVRAVAFSPDQRHLAAACTGRQLIVWDLADGRQVASVVAHKLPVYDVAYSPDGLTLITCSGDWTKPVPGNVKLWKAGPLTEIATLQGHASAVRSATFRPDGKQAASASEDGIIKIWDVATNIELTALHNSSGIREIGYSSDGKLVAAALHDGTINLWDLDKEAVVTRLRGDDDMFSVRFVPDDSVICGAGGDRRFLLWDISKLRPGATAKSVRAWSGKVTQE